MLKRILDSVKCKLFTELETRMADRITVLRLRELGLSNRITALENKVKKLKKNKKKKSDGQK